MGSPHTCVSYIAVDHICSNDMWVTKARDGRFQNKDVWSKPGKSHTVIISCRQIHTRIP